MNQLSKAKLFAICEVGLLVALFFVVAGVVPPAINEAHYFAKSKNYWDPAWCSNDIFATSGNPHLLFHLTFGALVNWFSLEVSAWIGRLIGWSMVAVGLRAVTAALTKGPLASLWVAIIWIGGTEGFDLAGEWVIGGIEGKVPAYGLMLMALRMMIDGRWPYVWVLLGLASAFHVLVGGWSVLIAAVIYWLHGKRVSSLRSQWLPLLLGGTIAMVGVYPALALTKNIPAETVSAAAKIYVYERLSHHLLPSALQATWYARHGFLILSSLMLFWLLRSDRQFYVVRVFTIGAIVIAVIGLAIGLLPPVWPGLAANLLRYYWFRMTDAVVPLGLALAWARLPVAGFENQTCKLFRGVIMMIALWVVANEALETSRMTVITQSGRAVSAIGMNTTPENRQRVVSDWIEICEWIDRTLPKDEILLTPRNQQSFKWYANRAEVVNWKDVPQDAARLVEWSQRFFEIFPQRLGTVRVTIRYPDLIRFRKQYGVRFMVVDRRYSGETLPLVQVYPRSPYETNATYAVYRLP